MASASPPLASKGIAFPRIQPADQTQWPFCESVDKGPRGNLSLFEPVHSLSTKKAWGTPFLNQRNSDFRFFFSDFVFYFQHVPLCIISLQGEGQESVHLFIPNILAYSLNIWQVKDPLSISLISRFSVLNFLLISNLFYVPQVADYSIVEMQL